MKKLIITAFSAICLAQFVPAEDSPETAMLKARSAHLEPMITKVSPSVYVASGYSPANISMIVGADGLVIVDTGMFPAHAKAVLDEFRKISDLPIKGIILTHGHGDHTGGASVFYRERDDKPTVYARSPFNSEGNFFQSGGVMINGFRGARQGGFLLPPEQRINNGIAPAVYPPKDRNVFAGNTQSPIPKKTFRDDRKKLSVGGVDLELVAAPGETADQLYVWYPKERVVFTGDNFYQSWPNLYAIRGTAYRNVQRWIQSLNAMIGEKPAHAVPGHTQPIVGEDKTIEVLTNYRDAMQHVFDKTIEGINKGMTPDQLVHYVKLPDELAELDYLREYYGNIEWGVRAIFSGYLGWFDGNPTNLFSLPAVEEAKQMAKLAGGEAALKDAAKKALDKGDAQWSAQLSDHLLALHPDDQSIRSLKADALERLAEGLLTATGRNYYLTVAQELRKGAGSASTVKVPVKADDKREANKKAALDFFQLVMGDRDYEAARKYVGEYIQHDPLIGDGYDALVEALETYPQWKNRPKSKVEFKNVAVDGDLVYLQTHREFKAADDGSPARRIVVHLFRFNDAGKIDEHWTVVQAAKLKDSVSKHPLF